MNAAPIQPKRFRRSLLVIPFMILFIAAGLSAIPLKLLPDWANIMEKMRWLQLILYLGTVFSAGYFLVALDENKKEQQKAEQHATAQAALEQRQAASANNEKERREYVLEIIGLGVTLDKYRQGKLWDALQKGSPYSTIREQDPKKYNWRANDKIGTGGSRVLDAFENGAQHTPKYWGLPSFYAGAPLHGAGDDPIEGLAGSTQGTGLIFHLWVNGAWQLAERPDRLLEQVFAFFDQHQDLPFVVLAADDSICSRDTAQTPGANTLVHDGYYIPEMPDAAAVFVLARRERVAPLRPYAWFDHDNNFMQEEFRQMYYKLMDTVPTDKKRDSLGVHYGRQPTTAEWLPAAATFAKHPEFHPEGHRKFGIDLTRFKDHPPKAWQATPWFPIPWNHDQLKAFDDLPSLGYLHRPVFVPFRDADGHPVTRREQRQHLLMEGWRQALHTLSDQERAQGPARVIAGTDNHKHQLLALTAMLHQYESEGGPAIDISQTAQFIDTDRRLGNTGAATFFVQMALGVMGSYREGGPSAAINLRDPDEASIIFISPPSEEKRKSQTPPFIHNVQPTVDPKNYEAPSVEALMQTGTSTAGKP